MNSSILFILCVKYWQRVGGGGGFKWITSRTYTSDVYTYMASGPFFLVIISSPIDSIISHLQKQQNEW